MRNILIALLVILLLIGGFFLYKSMPDRRGDLNFGAGIYPGTGSATEGKEMNTTRLIQELEGKWSNYGLSLSASLGFSPANGQWFLDGAQAIGNDSLLVQFEDGHDAHIAVMRYEEGSLMILKTFPHQTRFTLPEWNQLISQYGSPGYLILSFSKNSIRDGKIISYPNLAQVSENIFVKQ